MNYFDKLADMGFMVVIRRNRLNTFTIMAIRPGEAGRLSETPEWRLTDFVENNAADGARRLYEKLTLTGTYADWDNKMVGLGLYGELIGFEHRPPEDIFETTPT